MAYEKINLVTKLNKGTSKDEWGNFNFWGYKTPDGMTRARLFAPDDDGYSLLEVKKYEISPNSWRRKVTWEDAIHIGSSYIKISDNTKGFTSDEALREVNALIEIHNDYYAEHVGRKIRKKGYNDQYDAISSEVTGVSFHYDIEDNPTVTLYGERWSALESTVIDYTEEFARQVANEQFTTIQKKINEAQAYLNRCMDAYNDGDRVVRQNTGYGSHEGLIDGNTANQLAELVNKFAPEPVSS